MQSHVTSHPSAPEQSGNAETIVTATNKSNRGNLQQERKFNVVVYGIDKCPKSTPRHERSGFDLSNVAKTITKVDENVNPLFIRDLRHLGKHQEQSSRPRPILVSFNRAIDVSTLLSKTSSLQNGIQIKRDMTKDKRLVESILLKERWALIQKKTECKSIKISGNKIFVNSKLHGEVKNSSLVLKTSSEEDMDHA